MPAAQTLDSPRKSRWWWINLSDRGGTSQILPPTLSRKKEWHYDVCGQPVKCSHYVQYDRGHEATVRSQTSWKFFCFSYRCLQTGIIHCFLLLFCKQQSLNRLNEGEAGNQPSLHYGSTRMMSSNDRTADETVFIGSRMRINSQCMKTFASIYLFHYEKLILPCSQIRSDLKNAFSCLYISIHIWCEIGHVVCAVQQF